MQEMGFSNSTLNWLDDGEKSGVIRQTASTGVPVYDPTEPVAGRRRSFLVVGGAAVVALLVAGGFFVQAARRRAAEVPVSKKADPARDLVERAKGAFSANRIGEAIDLARLALVADGRFAEAHFVLAECERARGQLSPARDQYRKYLDLAPLGSFAAAARAALGQLAQ